MHRILPFLALFFILPVPLSAQQADEAPRLLVLPSRDHDFGDITHRDRPKARFELENISLDTVRISHVKSSCGCTVAVPDDSLLAPGEKAAVDVTFYPPRNASGTIHKSIVVYTEGRSHPDHVLRITANLLSDFSLTTKKLEMGEVQFRAKHVESFEITNTSDAPHDIVNIQSALAVEARESGNDFSHPIPMKDVEISPVSGSLQPGEKMKVTVTFRPFYRGRIMGSIVITATDEVMEVEFVGESK